MWNRLKKIIANPSIQTLGIFAGGNFLVAVIGGISSLIQARWISPEIFGEFRKYAIPTNYFAIGLIFVHDGVMRQYPYFIGKGEAEEGIQFVRAAKWWYLCLCHFFSSIFLILIGTSLWHGNFRAAAAWGVQIASIWMLVYGAYLGVIYRTSNDFKVLSINNSKGSVFGFVLLPLVNLLGYWGLCARSALQTAFTLYLNHHRVPLKESARFDPKRLATLVRISLPLSIPGYVNTSLLTATINYSVFHFLTERDLGIYGVASTLQAMGMTVTSAMQQMYWPRIGKKYGETHSLSACVNYALKPTVLTILAGTAIAAFVCIVISPFIRLFIPKYIDAIPIIRILALNIPLGAASIPFISYVMALKYKTLLSLSMVQTATCILCILILPKSLSMVAWSVVFGLLSYIVGGYLSLFLMKDGFARLADAR